MNTHNDRPSCACLYILMFIAMAITGMAMLCIAGDKLFQMGSWHIDGTWLAYPAAVCIGFLFLFPFMRLATRRK
jgi:Na+-driven multidrug efflux pump